MKDRMFALVAAALRALIWTIPIYSVRKFLWNKIGRPYVAWRPIRKTATSAFGMTFSLWLPDFIQRHIYFFGVWEPAVTQCISKSLNNGDIFIDIGANIGYDTLLAASCVGAGGKVYAIEASPSIYARLLQNIAMNRSSNIVPINVAVTDRPMRVPVYLHDDENIGASTILESVASRRTTTVEAQVDGKPLADIIPIADVLNARLIKIDVEGAEWLVVQGFQELIPQFSPRTEILIEVNAAALKEAGTSVREFLALFESAGFRPFFVPNNYDTAELYFSTKPVQVEPLASLAFEQADLLFRRQSVA
jgi:FkbM family methyltransferase